MPASLPDSTDSPPPSATPSSSRAPTTPSTASVPWRANAILFAATVVSVFATNVLLDTQAHEARSVALWHGAQFTAALMSILLAHEFGHYVAARLHSVDASLPYFLPLPLLSPFGTMGAVIRMRSSIPTRRALLDIGAAGPLAGLVLAIPLYAWGVRHSEIIKIDGTADGAILGSSPLMLLLDHWFAPSVPDGYDVVLSPVGLAAWGGMFVTMINLLPAGQLDGGHVAFALFGPRQDRLARWVHRSMLAFFFVSVASFVARDLRAGLGLWHLGRHVYNSLFWLVWFEVLALISAMSSRSGSDEVQLASGTRAFGALGLALLAGVLRDSSSTVLWTAWFAGLGVLLAMEAKWGVLRRESHLLDHPPTGAQPLAPGRAIVAVLTLAFFAALFMPTPFMM
ncbi:MAG TPA: site-2 protease family protein [Polyangiaceae bacterium]|nr:site-2 protease family protein [Polyangiaceae bacterium]